MLPFTLVRLPVNGGGVTNLRVTPLLLEAWRSLMGPTHLGQVSKAIP
jgi:hypothetical protein